MANWSFGFRFAIADLGLYTGPWPCSAPNWLALEAFTKEPVNWNIANAVRMEYITAPPPASGDPRDFDDFDDHDNISTWAEMGSYNTYDSRTSRYYAPTPWEFPSFWWNFWNDPPFSTSGPPRGDGIHFYVRIEWNFADERVKAIIRTLDPLALVPIGYAAHTKGPTPWPDGFWSVWQPRPVNEFFLNDFNGDPGKIDLAVYRTPSWSATASDWDTALTGARQQLIDTLPSGVLDSRSVVAQYSRLSISTTGGTKSVGIQAYQYAKAFDVDSPDLRVSPRIDLTNIKPSTFNGVLGGKTQEPTYWGVFDPYTFGGFGFQWEQPEDVDYLGLNRDSVVTTFGFAIQPSAVMPPACPIRLYAREYTGPVSAWLPLDGDALNLGDFTVQPIFLQSAGSGSYEWSGSSLGRIRFDRIPWRRFWLVAVPSFVFSDGPAPSISTWADQLAAQFPAGVNALLAIDGLFSGHFFNTEQHFAQMSLRANYRLPRWRYWKPVIPNLNLPPAAAAPGGRHVIFKHPSNVSAR